MASVHVISTLKDFVVMENHAADIRGGETW